ncbi:outer membrane beta-barrel protein [uncultured Roseovarius sp.]|uniref:outer membrane protein n=1 Tax=uncultured Roseovarius sp. TaxID=293344 RepID=UPI00260BBEF1|nr:outer membrane beta-barrel protein [uncultured Roseovarius sp.]
MKKKFVVFVTTMLLSGSALAQSHDWSGAYVGAQLGFANVDSNIVGANGDGFIAGIVGGYDWDIGAWVLGLGADLDFANIGLGQTADLEEVWRIKFRGGYKIGRGLAYGTAGYANADTDVLGDDDGYFIGAGYEHLLAPNFSVGGEVLYHEFDNFNSTPADIDATTVQVRGTFRF